jgi:hypothetical protein
MNQLRRFWVVGGGAVAVAALALTPAVSAPGNPQNNKKIQRDTQISFGGFTPASADPRLAAILARTTMRTSVFRFTPVNNRRPSRAVTVAVRTQTRAVTIAAADQPAANLANLGVNPVGYNLGVSVGWKKFALSGEVAQADLGALQGGRRVAGVGVSFVNPTWSTRMKIAAERPTGNTLNAANVRESVAVDFGGTYSLTRKIDLTAGVRYKAERDRLGLEPKNDTRRDSQAVYVGTAFRF